MIHLHGPTDASRPGLNIIVFKKATTFGGFKRSFALAWMFRSGEVKRIRLMMYTTTAHYPDWRKK